MKISVKYVAPKPIKKVLYCKGDVITGLIFYGCKFDIKVDSVIKHEYYDRFSQYSYSIYCYNNDYHELKELLFPLTHSKLDMLIKGDLPENYNNNYCSL